MNIFFIFLIFLVTQYKAYSLKNQLPDITKFNYINNDLTINELINKMDSQEIHKILINKNGNEILSADNTLNIIHHTKIEPYIIQNIITKSLEDNVDIEFYKSVGYDIIPTIINNYIIPGIFIVILLNYIIVGTNINNNSSNKNGFGIPNPFNRFSSKTNTFDASKYNITLSSWVGNPEIFEECIEVISYIKNSTNYKRLGAELPKGILLDGPPGVGKTLLAKAISSETNSSFIAVSGSEFIELFVGMGASRVRDLFSEARDKSPCIIFIDEIDAIGKQRGNGNSLNNNDEREQTLNQLLAEMDGFNNNDGILILAATNRKDILDKALLRPGRFDRIIRISLPDKTSREQIIKSYLDQKKYIDKNIDTNSLAELTDGYSGAELKNLINEAAILSARKGLDIIGKKEISDALEKSIIGLIRKTDTRLPETKLRISIHEIGHAFLAMYYSEYFDLQKVSIKSTFNGAGGYTIFNEKPKYKDGLYTRDILLKRLIITMAGKAAESIFYNNEQMSLGATQDLKQGNELARKMIGIFGMGEKLETFYNKEIESDTELFSNKYSEKIKETFDLEALQLVSDAYNIAKIIITKNKIICDELVNLLLEKEILNNEDLILLQNKFNFL